MVAWLGWWCYVFHWQSVFYRSTERCSHTFVALVLPRNRWVLEVGRFLVNPLPMDRWTLWDKGFHRCCFTDGPMDPLRQGVPPLLLYRWTDGPPEARSMVKLWLIYSTVWPVVCHFVYYSFDRWSAIVSAIRLTDGPLIMPRGCSLTCETAWPTWHIVQSGLRKMHF